MSVYLEHHRVYCDGLSRLNELGVSWDGLGGVPLRRKALQSAMELFGQRPDLTIGAEVGLVRGGMEVGLFRSGRDLRVQICAAGTVVVSGHFPRRRPDVLISMRTVSRAGIAELEAAIPFASGRPILDHVRPDDVSFLIPFDGFCVMRLIPRTGTAECRLLIGRRSLVTGLYAYHDAADLPEDLFVDQPLPGGARLSGLISGYLRELFGPEVRA